MGDKGTVAVDCIQPYLSAINNFLLNHGKPLVALGPMVTGVRKGLANCQRDIALTPERLSLPAPAALVILEKAEELLKIVQWAAHDYTDIMLMRACIATIASYVFFCRGECGACARREDLVVNTTHITLRLSKENGHQHLREGLKHTSQIMAGDMPRVARAMKALFKGTKERGRMRERRWAMTALEDEAKWTASTSTDWLKPVMKAARHNPPLGFS